VTAKDYAEFNKVHHTRKKLIPILVWSVALLITVLFYTLGDKSDLKYDSTAFMIFLFVFTFAVVSAVVWAFFFLFKLIVFLLGKLFYKENMSFKDAEITINTIGVKAESVKDSFFAGWHQINKITETDKAFYFYHTKNAAFIFPKRYIEFSDEYVHLREFLDEVQKRETVTDYN
jgi:hypothetical protein